MVRTHSTRGMLRCLQSMQGSGHIRPALPALSTKCASSTSVMYGLPVDPLEQPAPCHLRGAHMLPLWGEGALGAEMAQRRRQMHQSPRSVAEPPPKPPKPPGLC